MQKKGFLQFERCFAPFFPQTLFSKTLSVCHFLLFFFFCLPLQHPFLSSSIPFQIIVSLCFVGSIFVAPFLSSFLLLSFQPLSCHPLLQSTLLSFLVVWLFCSSCLNDIVFRLGVSFFVLLVVFLSFFLFLLSFCGVCCFGFRLWHRRKVFSLRFWWFLLGGGLCNTNLGPDVLLALTWGGGVLKNKALNNGTHFCFQLWVKCVCLLPAGRGGALN